MKQQTIHCVVEYDASQALFIGRVQGFPHFEQTGATLSEVEVRLRKTVARLSGSGTLRLDTHFVALIAIELDGDIGRMAEHRHPTSV